MAASSWNPFKWITVTSVSIAVFAAYFAFTASQIYGIMFPTWDLNPGDLFLGPLWKEGQVMDGECYISPRPNWVASDFTSSRVSFMGHFNDLSFDSNTNAEAIEFNISSSANDTTSLNAHMWSRLRHNETVYLHVHLTQRGASPNPNKPNYHKLLTLHQVTPLTKIAETNPYLLTVTMAVSMLHILFDWLAFKSDISFWQQNESLVGISIWSMVSSLVSQTIVFLYLIEQHTTLLIVVPSGISIVIQLWKLGRATRPKVSLSWTTLVKIEFTRTDMSSASNDIDKVAMTYMGYTLYPMLVGYSVYSLLHKDHTSFYSWILGSLTGSVYAFGTFELE
ncbi:hypothetical protein AaE_000495 [Aphanomyces astaci]|uniref:Uncharacterized protein n=1 Tax=Aphanomyces astaci TaxID=112090 RepID=A0A6A5B489_APHAT|nr:hypothetical protein AaE_000495 [Aphanomyces astaci]